MGILSHTEWGADFPPPLELESPGEKWQMDKNAYEKFAQELAMGDLCMYRPNNHKMQ